MPGDQYLVSFRWENLKEVSWKKLEGKGEVQPGRSTLVCSASLGFPMLVHIYVVIFVIFRVIFNEHVAPKRPAAREILPLRALQRLELRPRPQVAGVLSPKSS